MSPHARELGRLFRGETRRTLSNSLVALIFSFGCGVVSARLLGPVDRGILTLTLLIAATSALIAALGSNVAIRVYLGSNRRAQMRAYVTLSALLVLVQGGLVTGAMVVMCLALGLRASISSLVGWGLVVGLTAFVAQQALDALNAVGRTATSALANALGSVVTMMILIVAFVLDLGLWAAMFSYSVGATVTTVHAVLAYRRDTSQATSGVGGSRSFLVRRGIGFLGMNLGQALALKLDHYAVGFFSGAAATGIYGVAAAHAAPTQVSSFAIGQVVLHQASQGTLSRRRLAQYLSVASGIAAAVAVAAWFIAPWFIPFVFGPEFGGAVPVLRVLMVGQIALAPYLISTRVLAGAGQSRLASASGIGLLVLLGTALVVLTPRFGPIGAAWATTSSLLVASIVMIGAAIVRHSSRRPGAGRSVELEDEVTRAL